MLLPLFFLAAQGLAQAHIDTLSDAQLCDAAREAVAGPSARVADVGPIDFQEWEVSCEEKLLRMPVRLPAIPELEEAMAREFASPAFCRQDNLLRLWQRGWRFELRLLREDGSARDLRSCG